MKGRCEPARTSEVDQLVADAVEVACGLGHRVNSVPPPASGENVPVGAEDGVKLLVKEQVLLPLVQDPVAGPQAYLASVGSQQPVAEAVNGGDAHAGAGSRDTAGLRRRGESLSQFHRRVPAEGAEHQLIGSGLSQEQQVDRPALDAAGLAGTGSRHYQQRAVGVADDLPLPGVELRAQASDHGCDGHGPPWFPGCLGEDVVRGTGVRLQAMTGISPESLRRDRLLCVRSLPQEFRCPKNWGFPLQGYG